MAICTLQDPPVNAVPLTLQLNAHEVESLYRLLDCHVSGDPDQRPESDLNRIWKAMEETLREVFPGGVVPDEMAVKGKVKKLFFLGMKA